MGPKNTFFFLVLVFVALITKQVESAQYDVGGSQGWEATTNFVTWVSDKTFKVGDQLGMLILILLLFFVNQIIKLFSNITLFFLRLFSATLSKLWTRS